MKKTKVIIPALGILLLSTAASVTGTVAWFTAANDVDVSGLNFQAQSEQAIVVANEGKTQWKNAGVQASHNGEGKTFLNTSTGDMASWYHAYSSDANDGQATVDRVTLTVTQPTAGTADTNTGLGVVSSATGKDSENNDVTVDTFNGQNVYLLNRFYVQSATQVKISNQDIYVKDLTVTGATKNAELDASLRIGFVYGSDKTIFAPVTGATLNYGVNGATSGVTAIANTSAGVALNTAAVEVPIFTSNGASAIELNVFIWFEGEDANNKSANIKDAMDNLSITFKLGNRDHE